MPMCDCSLELDVIDSLYKRETHMGTIAYVYALISRYAHMQATYNNEAEEDILARLINEANDRAKREDTPGGGIHITFPIKYVRDIVLLSIFMIYHKVPIKQYLRYAYFAEDHRNSYSAFLLYSKYSIYNSIIAHPIELDNVYTDIICISDQTYLAGGVRFCTKGDDDFMTGVFGIGSIVTIHARKNNKNSRFRLEYLMIRKGGETGFDDFD